MRARQLEPIQENEKTLLEIAACEADHHAQPPKTGAKVRIATKR